MLRGRKWTLSNLSGTALVHTSFCCKKTPAQWAQECCISGRKQLNPRLHQSGDNPLSQEPHIRGPVSSYGGLQSRGQLSWLLSTMGILGHARWPVWIQLSLGTRFCFLPADPHLCQIAILWVICCLHPHKDCCFIFDSLQAGFSAFNWILDFEALMVPQSTTAFVCLEQIFVEPELVKSIILPLPFSGDVLLLSCIQKDQQDIDVHFQFSSPTDLSAPKLPLQQIALLTGPDTHLPWSCTRLEFGSFHGWHYLFFLWFPSP